MYSKSLFPESRGDLLGLLETIDRIPNQAQSVLRRALNQRILIPSWMCPGMLELTKVARQCADTAIMAAAKLFQDFAASPAYIRKIDELESEADHILAELIEKLYLSNTSDFEKILLGGFLENIEEISDRAEGAANRIRIIVAKRRI
jgi:predicted phosphate transport protein (TIGR00153 family)